VKKFLFLITTLFYISPVIAQQAIERKSALTDLVTEKFQTVIAKNKPVKQGSFNAFYNKTILIANGNFSNDKKTGLWSFFDQDGKLSEKFDYNTNQLIYEAPEDSASNIRYSIDNQITKTDMVTKPIRPGGRYFGYIPYLKLFRLPTDMADINPDRYTVILELLVSAGGRLAEYKIHIRTYGNDRVLSVNTDLLNEEDREFIPATINKQPILSNIIIQCYITRRGGLDM
jgi:hypothetical protein